MSDQTDFERFRPEITEVTVVQAAKSLGEGDALVSLNGRRTAIDAFILMLATDAQTHGPFLLNSTCARELCALLVEEGFGPIHGATATG